MSAELLVACLRQPWRRGPLPPELRARALAAGAGLRDTARQAGLLPLLAARLLESGSADAALLEARALGVAHGGRARAELAEGAGALAAAGVEAVAIKGPALEAATGLAGPRAASDLDVWLPRRSDLGRAARALERFGSTSGLEAEREGHDLDGRPAGLVLRAPGRLEVDLHVELLDPLVRPRGPRPGPAERGAAAPGGARTLDPAWTLVLAAAHLHKELLGLRRLVDLAALLERTGPDDRARALALCRRLGLSGVLRTGAALAVDWLGAPDPGWGRRPATWAQAACARRLAWPARTVVAGLEPATDRARARAHLARWLLLDDAPRVLCDRLLRLLWPHPAYAASRGGRASRLARLIARV